MAQKPETSNGFKVIFRIENVTFEADLLEFKCGIPQSLILDALLFLVYVIDLDKTFHLLIPSC